MKKILILSLFFLTQVAYPQQTLDVVSFNKLKTTEERLDFLSPENVVKMDSVTFNALLPIIEEKKDYKVEFYWHFQLNMNSRLGGNIGNAYQNNIEKMVDIARTQGLKAESAIAQYNLTLNQYSNKKINEQQLYSSYLNCFEQIKSMGFDKIKWYIPEWILNEIGRNFYELGDSEKALECLFEAEKVGNYGSQFYTLSMNLIETIYAERNDYANAIVYAKKIYDVNYSLNPTQNRNDWLHTFWQGLASLNIAYYLFELGKIKECEAYASRGYELIKNKEGVENGERIMAEFEALQVVIRIKLSLGKINEVEPLFKRVEVLRPDLGVGMEGFYFKPLHLYRNYVNYYEAKKDYTNAFHYVKLANDLQDSLNRRNDKRKLWQIESRVKTEKYQSQIKSVEENRLFQERLRNAAILLMLLVIGATFVIYHRIKRDNTIITLQKAQLEESLAEKETLLKEIHHRVKNNLQIISGLLEKQALKTNDALTKKLMKEGQDRVFSMALVHQNLYQSDSLNVIEIKHYLDMLTKNIRQSHTLEEQNIQLTMDVDDSTVDIDTAIPLGLILNELITNCYKYAFKGKQTGEITIVFHQNDKALFLSVKDNGIGLPTDFDIQKTRTLGMNLVRGLVRQLNGALDFHSNTEGSVFFIKI